MRRGVPLWALVAAVVVVALLLFLTLFERTELVVDNGFTGAARREPFFALRHLLAALGARTTGSSELRADYGGRHTLLVFLPPGTIGDERGAELLGWVAQGGHLVATPQPGLTAPFGIELVAAGAAAEESPDGPTLELEPRPGERVSVAMWQPQRMRLTHRPEFAAGPEDGRLVARYRWQEGRVTFLADASFLTNARLREGAHAEALWLLLAAVEPPSWVELVVQVERTSLAALLARHAWTVLLAAALWLVLWIWRRGLRHGPLLPDPPPARRSLLEHVAATGDFYFRQGELGVLAASSRRGLWRRAARRLPAWSRRSERERIELLAAGAGLAPVALAAALRDESNLTPAELLHRLQMVERVEKAL